MLSIMIRELAFTSFHLVILVVLPQVVPATEAVEAAGVVGWAEDLAQQIVELLGDSTNRCVAARCSPALNANMKENCGKPYIVPI